MYSNFSSFLSPLPSSYFSFQPVLHDWYNNGSDMYYPLWERVYKGSLAVNWKG